VSNRKRTNSKSPQESVVSGYVDSGSGDAGGMTGHGWFLPTLAALFGCATVGCSAYVFSGGSDVANVIAVLALVTGGGLLALAVGLYVQSRAFRGHVLQLRNEVRTSDRSSREASSRTDYLAQQILELRNRGEQINSTILEGFSELKSSYGALSDQMRDLNRAGAPSASSTFGVGSQFKPFPPDPAAFGPNTFARGPSSYKPSVQPANPMGTSRPIFGHVPPTQKTPISATEHHEDHDEHLTALASQSQSLVDRLLTSLEPVVDLFTSKTTHYRLHLGMVREDGEEVASETVLHHADRTGLRAGFDLHAAREALQLLQRLRQRDAGLSIFLPVGAHTLQSGETVDRLVGLLSEYGSVANGLVLEIPHAMLAGLSDLGLEGLAKLARGGHTLALSNVSTSGVDLPALSKLNVRFVSINVANVLAGDGLSKAILQFAQVARSLRVQMVVTNVSDQRVVSHISKITRFASGPVFAEPRRVRSDATTAQPMSYSNVA
jgi:EAL domain-containing protein (putative c-di-GMP-specific phosphodiesterase class I)